MGHVDKWAARMHGNYWLTCGPRGQVGCTHAWQLQVDMWATWTSGLHACMAIWHIENQPTTQLININSDSLPLSTMDTYLISSHFPTPNLLLISFSKAEFTNPYCRCSQQRRNNRWTYSEGTVGGRTVKEQWEDIQ